LWLLVVVRAVVAQGLVVMVVEVLAVY